MWSKGDLLQDLYDARGKFLGLLISPRLWTEVEAKVAPILEEAMGRLQQNADERQRVQEPLQDWEMLLKHWDFKYPVSKEVFCEVCGNQTQDWQEDSPRKFLLKAANLGGLVGFECLHCGSRITKKHLKDYVQVQTQPAQK
ncbi:MAG: hypothetical protein ACQEQX_00430 [Thermodesulfobacteriota bacterium]